MKFVTETKVLPFRVIVVPGVVTVRVMSEEEIPIESYT